MRRATGFSLRLALIAVASSSTPARAGPERPKAAVFVVAEGEELEASRREALQISMERALREDRRIEQVDLDRRLADRAGLVPHGVISEARGLLRSGRALLEKDRGRRALERLQAAERQLERVLTYAPREPLAEAQFAAGATHARLGDLDRAKSAWTRLLVWRPEHAAHLALAGPRGADLWERVRREAKERPRRSLVVTSEPEGARAFVDGRPIGLTPVIAEDLPTGRHYVTLTKPGFQRVATAIDVSVQGSPRVREDLKPSPGYSRVLELAALLAEDLGAERIGPALEELRGTLEIDHAVFVRAPPADGENARYQGFVYDARDRALLARAESAVRGDVDAAFAELARALYTFLEARPAPAKPIAPAPEDPLLPAFTRTWWFWAGVGAVAAAAATPFLLSELGDDGCPNRALCGAVILEF